MRVLALALLAAAGPAAACGEDRFSVAGQFDDPSDFGRADCAPGSLAGLDPVGIWNADVLLPDSLFQRAIRIDAGPSAAFNGYPATVTASDDDLFVRLEYGVAQGGPGLIAYDACARDPDGSLRGKAAFCSEGGCSTGTFLWVRLARRPGEGEAEGLDKLAEWYGDPPWSTSLTLNVRAADGTAYVVRRRDLRLVDVSDPAAPRDLGASLAAPHQNDYNDVKLVDGTTGERYALVASASRGVVVIDVSDPQHPGEVTTFPQGGANVHTLFTETIDGTTLAYLANLSTAGLDVYDVTRPTAPVRLGGWVHPQAGDYVFVHDLYVADRIAYLDYWGAGLVVVDATDPAHIVELGEYGAYPRPTNHSNWVTAAGGRKVSVMGDESFYAHTRIVDVDPQSPAFMTEIGSFELRPEVSVHNIMAIGGRAYVTHYQDGLRLLDLADPTRPTQIAYYNSWDPATALGESFFEGAIGVDVDPQSGVIYLADTERGLLILREPN